ncbi:hypothetical protein D3C81_1395500 [compost metagenome]
MLAFAEQRGHGHLQVLAEQVEHCRLDRRHGMDRDAQIEGLQAAATGVPVRKRRTHLVQHGLVLADRLAHHQRTCILQRLADALPARHLAHAGIAGAVLEDHDIAGEVRAVGAGQVHQHAVMARHGHDGQRGDDGRGNAGMLGCGHVDLSPKSRFRVMPGSRSKTRLRPACDVWPSYGDRSMPIIASGLANLCVICHRMTYDAV